MPITAACKMFVCLCVQTGDVVVDPMCGKASILVEAVQDSLISKVKSIFISYTFTDIFIQQFIFCHDFIVFQSGIRDMIVEPNLHKLLM